MVVLCGNDRMLSVQRVVKPSIIIIPGFYSRDIDRMYAILSVEQAGFPKLVDDYQEQ